MLTIYSVTPAPNRISKNAGPFIDARPNCDIGQTDHGYQNIIDLPPGEVEVVLLVTGPMGQFGIPRINVTASISYRGSGTECKTVATNAHGLAHFRLDAAKFGKPGWAVFNAKATGPLGILVSKVVLGDSPQNPVPVLLQPWPYASAPSMGWT